MASPIIQNTFANAPYKDDFADSDNYHRILFKSGRAVQARELTQMQTMIQKEIERFGNNVFKDGAAVNPVQNVSVDNRYAYVKLGTTTFNGTAVGKEYTGGTSGVKAKVLETVAAEGSDPATIYVQYTSGNGTSGVFAAGEALTASGGQTLTVASSNATGYGTKVNTSSGDFFAMGHFVFVEGQSLILSKYSSEASGVVGFQITEEIITEADDTALYDNQGSTPNLSAPGAHRYKISGTLINQDDVDSDGTFVYLARIENGKVLNINTGASDYNRILKVMAQRTHEESGNYVVEPFTSHFEADSDDDYLLLNIGSGVAYVNGYRAAPGSQKLRIPKPTDTINFNNEAISASYGNYVVVSTLTAMFDVGSFESVNLRDNATYGSGSTIGTARVRAMEAFGSNYKIYLFDIQMNSNQSFRSVKSLGTSSTRNAVLSLENGQAVLKDQGNHNLFFPLPRTRPSSISGTDYTYSVLRYASDSASNNTITLTKGTGETFDDTSLWMFSDAGASGAILDPTNINTSTGVVTFDSANGPVESVYIVQKGGSGSPTPYKTKDLTNTTVTATVTSDSSGDYIDLGKEDIYNVTRVRAVDSDGADLSGSFYLDNGQRDNYYALGRMNLAPGASIPSGNVFVRFNYFNHVGNGDFFCVNSYDSAEVAYGDIPSYRQADGTRIELRDVLDFRPTKTSSGFESGSELPRNTDLITIDPTYYLPRIDKLTVQDDGSIKYLSGAPDLNPKPPVIPNNAMELYTFKLNPATLNETDLLSVHVDNRRYTMRDIAKLHKKINKVEEMATLSLLDIAASTLEVLDSSGNPRTKAGFLTDDFKDHRAANVDDLEYRASIDPTAGILRPAFREKNVTLTFDSDLSSDSDTVLVGDDILLSYTETEYQSQLEASRTQNVNPYTIINYQGRIALSPSSDESRDTTSIRLRTNGRNEIGIETFLNNVLGSNDTKSVLSTIENDPEFSGRTEFIRTRISLADANNFTTAGSLEDALETLPPSTSQILGSVFDRIEPTWREYQWGWAGIDSRQSEENLVNGGTPTSTFGRFATRLFVPRIRSREIRFKATGLKPNTRHYPFFDGVRVDPYCVQLEDDAEMNWSRRANWTWTDEGFTNRLFRQFKTQYWHPSFGASAPSSLATALTSNANGLINGSFFIPNDGNLSFFAGAREFALYDITSTDDQNSTSRAWADYTVEGTNTVRFKKIRPRKDPELDTLTSEGGKGTSLFIIALFLILLFDPIAQSFTVDNPEGAFITKIGVYFASKSELNIPIDLEIRPMVNGYPSSDEIVQGGFKQLLPTDITADDEDALVETAFEFDAPVYLEGNKEYAFVLRAATTEYEVWISRVGDFVLGRTDKKITKQPTPGSMFLSQNGSTWEASQWDDIKYKIYRADFATSGTAYLKNDKVEPRLLVPNPILFDSGSDVIRIIHPNHGLTTSDSITLNNIDSSQSYPMLISSFSGSRSITSVDGTGYTIEADSNADASARLGGEGIYVSDNVIMDEVYPSIEIDAPSGTGVKMVGKFSYGKSFAGTETPYGTETTYAHNLEPFQSYKFDRPRVIVSEDYEDSGSYPTTSATIKASLYTNSSYVSPRISAERCSLTAISNIIDNQDSSAASGYNVPISYIDETDPIGGTQLAKYVTKPVSLEEDAVGLKIILAANRPSGTNFKVYYKVLREEETLNTKGWVLVDPEAFLQTDENPNKFREYRYQIGGFGSASGADLDPFNTYQIKIVMTSNNSSKVPTFKDLRAIALAV